MKKSEKPIDKIKVKKSIFKRLFFHILVLFILAVIVSGTLNCIENIQRTRRFTRQLTESASKVATETFERCDINALLDNPDSEEYRKAVKTLRWICQTNHLEYMYIYIPNFDENKVTYVMTVADDDSEKENALNVRSAGAEVDHGLWDAEKEAWENPNLVTAYEYQNDSFGSFSPYIQWVVTIFMILFGVNFNAYFLLLMRRFRRAAASEEVRAYFLIIAVAVGIITCNIYSMYNGLGEALRQAAFQVGSIITTTGFSSCDFDLWPTLSKEILVMLMFVGACAGSTGGGMKVSRLLILGKTLKKELRQALHPQVVAPARMDGKLLNHETIRATNVYVAAYIFIFAASFLLISLDGFDMVTNFTAIAATLNNIGPGLNQVGPMMNFGSYSNPAKLVMIFDMLAGRLEIFPMLVFFLPDTWRRF
jgi:hypothetical protein